MKNVFEGLGSCPTGTFICIGDLEVKWAAQQSAVAGSQWEEDGLLVNGINNTVTLGLLVHWELHGV